MPLDAWTSARVLLKREGVQVGRSCVAPRRRPSSHCSLRQGLFRGLMPSTVGNLPGQLIYFGVYEYRKTSMARVDVRPV